MPGPSIHDNNLRSRPPPARGPVPLDMYGRVFYNVIGIVVVQRVATNFRTVHAAAGGEGGGTRLAAR